MQQLGILTSFFICVSLLIMYKRCFSPDLSECKECFSVGGICLPIINDGEIPDNVLLHVWQNDDPGNHFLNIITYLHYHYTYYTTYYYYYTSNYSCIVIEVYLLLWQKKWNPHSLFTLYGQVETLIIPFLCGLQFVEKGILN